MDVQTFQAEDISQGLNLVKEALGPDAVIISSQRIKTPGLFGKSVLEIKATRPNAAPPPKVPVSGSGPQAWNRLRARKAVERIQEEDGVSFVSRGAYGGRRPGNDFAWRRAFDRADIDGDLASYLSGHALHSSGNAAPAQGVVAALQGKLSPWFPRYRKTRIAFVGPTGVGKTTTLAKVAARMALVERRQVALATVDTYRVGAVDQLGQYAELIGVPLEVIRSKQELSAFVRRHRDDDVLLLDTAGRGPGDAEHLVELRSMCDENQFEVHLTLDASTRLLEWSHKLERYFKLAPTAAIYTKLDEAVVWSAVANVSAARSLPISYLACGQRVPEDLLDVVPDKLAHEVVMQCQRLMEADSDGLSTVGAA